MQGVNFTLDFGHGIFHRLFSPLPLASARFGWGSLLNHSNIILESLNELKMKGKKRVRTQKGATKFLATRLAAPQQSKSIDFRFDAPPSNSPLAQTIRRNTEVQAPVTTTRKSRK